MIEALRYSRREDRITTDLDGVLVVMCPHSDSYFFGISTVAHAIRPLPTP